MVRRPNVFQARRKAQKKARTEAFHHNVYVVLLKPEVARLRKVRRENPIRIEERPCVYVGMTGLSPEERFSNHKAGITSCRIGDQGADWQVIQHDCTPTIHG